ncbi:MAG: TolC family outer membrane protein [Janthinobacterium lividum]
MTRGCDEADGLGGIVATGVAQGTGSGKAVRRLASLGLPAACAAALWVLPAAAQTAPAVPHTLQEALANAYTTNPTLLQERAHLRSVDENVPTALAGWRPQVSFTGSTGYAAGTYTAPTGVVTGGVLSTPNNHTLSAVQATIIQPIYRGGRTTAGTHQAVNNVLAERASLLSTEETVFANVINAYVTVIQDYNLLQLNINNENVLKRQLQATNDRFRVGEITRTDVAQAESALSGASATRETSEGTLQSARAAYVRYIGSLPADNLTEPQPIKLPTKTEQETFNLALSNNPSVLQAQFNEAAAKDAVDVAFSALMPQLSAQGTAYEQINQAVSNTNNTGAQVTVNLSLPIYQGGSEYAAVRQARQTALASQRAVDDAKRQALQQATQAYETYVAAKSTIESTRAQIKANRIALNGVEREAIVGSRTTLDVLNAQQLLLSSQTTLVQNLSSVVTASYGVASAIGRLTARDLGLNVPLYDDTAYYNAVRNRLWGTGDYATSQPAR